MTEKTYQSQEIISLNYVWINTQLKGGDRRILPQLQCPTGLTIVLYCIRLRHRLDNESSGHELPWRAVRSLADFEFAYYTVNSGVVQ